jgi:AcrR family transcriptional regulator
MNKKSKPTSSAPSATPAENKHQSRSTNTRELFICAAQKLYAQRSIDSVSLSEITVAAGQKNRNALQYHFGNREGLLQAILDRHAGPVHELRRGYISQAKIAPWSSAEASARVFIMPIADYINTNPEAVHYVKVLSQMAALNSDLINPNNLSTINFQPEDELNEIMHAAFSHLHPVEARQRLFLVVSITFHSIADICRAKSIESTNSALRNHAEMFEQLVCAVEALISSPPRR